MKIAFFTNEFPPHVYGGAGVHAEYLSHALARSDGHSVELLCFGDQRTLERNFTAEGVTAPMGLPSQNARFAKLIDTLGRNVVMTGRASQPDVVHCHTWYTHLAGCLVKSLFNAPLVLTTHSLEPHRPWKAEQLGEAYRVSTWLEATAYRNADGVIAVSESMRRDVRDLYQVDDSRIKVIPNGIDIDQYHKVDRPEILARHGIDPNLPFVLFVGRITRQKGVLHLLNALPSFMPGIQVVLCAGAPDTEELGQEVERLVESARRRSPNPIHWIPTMLPKDEIIALYSHASLFICPSVYEPFGIINLEAMACETPVVASAVGGIPEVVLQGKTGLLVPFRPRGETDFEPVDPEGFSRALAEAVNQVMASETLRVSMAKEARKRVVEHFSWTEIARKTLNFYQELIDKHGTKEKI